MDFKTTDAASYDPVTGAFARFTSVATKPLASKLVRCAAVEAHHRVLDIGTGSGIVALEVATHLRAQGFVAGIDLSAPMLAEAKRRAGAPDRGGRIFFIQSDAEILPFSDHSFDRAVSLFALLHFPHPERAVSEMARVLKPGGRLAIGIGSPPPYSWSGLLHRLSRLPDVVRLKTGRLLLAPSFLDRIVLEELPARRQQDETELARHRGLRISRVVRLIEAAGLKNVHTEWHANRLDLRDPEEFWELQRTFSSIARKRLNEALPDETARVRARFLEASRKVLARGGTLCYHNAAFLIAGDKG